MEVGASGVELFGIRNKALQCCSVPRKSNTNWAAGRPSPKQPQKPTEFDQLVHELKLGGEALVHSEELRRWCNENRHRCYVPEWLLKAWGMSVDPNI